ncbi:MAG TPA: sugar phosphate isomerase/epimerase [Solibacterales bacterium]|nr:sugar phosphate isomerase/epimerase [Bryobacterales bacterium]
MTRREFGALLAGAPALTAAEPAKIKLGMDAYSLRAFGWKAPRLIEYAAGLGLDSVQMSIDAFESHEPAALAALKDKAAAAGVALEANVGCVCPSSSAWNPKNISGEEYLRRGLKVAKAVGSPSMRCFIGSQAERRGSPGIDAHLENTLRILRAVRAEALDTGVKIAVENHKDATARELRALIDAAGTDFTGACLDLGNPASHGEDPALAIEVLGPVTVTTHWRDTAVAPHPRGATFQWTALGEGTVPFSRYADMFRRVCPQVTIQLEIITGRAPEVIPYLEPEFWEMYPKLPAADFARFVTLVQNGRPYLGPMLVTGPGPQPPEFAAAMREQQRLDFERSVKHARERLKLGWRA